MLWRFLLRHRGCTSTAHSLRNNRCRYYGFRGCAAVYTAGFPRVLRWCKTQCRCRGACHTASADLKELPSADLHGLLLVSTLSRPIYIRLLRAGSGSYFSLRKGPQRSRIGSISLHPREGFVTEYHNVGVCVLIWLIESEKKHSKRNRECDKYHRCSSN